MRQSSNSYLVKHVKGMLRSCKMCRQLKVWTGWFRLSLGTKCKLWVRSVTGPGAFCRIWARQGYGPGTFCNFYDLARYGFQNMKVPLVRFAGSKWKFWPNCINQPKNPLIFCISYQGHFHILRSVPVKIIHPAICTKKSYIPCNWFQGFIQKLQNMPRPGRPEI